MKSAPLLAFAAASGVWGIAFALMLPVMTPLTMVVAVYLFIAPLTVSASGLRPRTFVVLWIAAIVILIPMVIEPRMDVSGVALAVAFASLYGTLAFAGWAATGGAAYAALKSFRSSPLRS